MRNQLLATEDKNFPVCPLATGFQPLGNWAEATPSASRSWRGRPVQCQVGAAEEAVAWGNAPLGSGRPGRARWLLPRPGLLSRPRERAVPRPRGPPGTAI